MDWGFFPALQRIATIEMALGRESIVAERVLGSGFRVLLGVVGAAALCGGLLVGATELRYAYLGSPAAPTLLVALIAACIALGGGVLIRGALRGRIAVRPPRRNRG